MKTKWFYCITQTAAFGLQFCPVTRKCLFAGKEGEWAMGKTIEEFWNWKKEQKAIVQELT